MKRRAARLFLFSMFTAIGYLFLLVACVQVPSHASVQKPDVAAQSTGASETKCTLVAKDVQDFRFQFTYTWSGGKADNNNSIDFGNPYDYYPWYEVPGVSGNGVVTYTYPYITNTLYTATMYVYGENETATCQAIVTTQKSFGEPTCKFEVREGDKFNHFDFKIGWTNAYGSVPFLDLGDDTPGPNLAEGIRYPNADYEWGEYYHDYPWDVFRGYSVYTATVVVPGRQGQDPAICQKQITVLDPSWGGQPGDEPECTLEARHPEGAPFNYWEFQVTWFAATDMATINYGDGGEDQNLHVGPKGAIDFGPLWHEYAWDVETGKAQYTARLTVPSDSDFGPKVCTAIVDIVDPNHPANRPKLELWVPRVVSRN